MSSEESTSPERRTSTHQVAGQIGVNPSIQNTTRKLQQEPHNRLELDKVRLRRTLHATREALYCLLNVRMVLSQVRDSHSSRTVSPHTFSIQRGRFKSLRTPATRTSSLSGCPHLWSENHPGHAPQQDVHMALIGLDFHRHPVCLVRRHVPHDPVQNDSFLLQTSIANHGHHLYRVLALK